MTLYPNLAAQTISDDKSAELSENSSDQPEMEPQNFRLQKIGELESFLRSEVQFRSALSKKYSRAVNMINGISASSAIFGLGAGATGAALLVTGVGLVPGIILEAFAVLSSLFDIAGVAIGRRCSAKAAKHEAIRVLASSKLDTIHSHVLKALEDNLISDDEYKLILEEIEKYRVMKDEIRSTSVGMVEGSISEGLKKELINKGREKARADFIKQLAASESP